ncbi:hypothetical protein [Nocardia anaemiae]|uniref:hypothetical protein n=1 Tax=Nocardia anaemiae TaxID=263910 RepID=UPI000B2B27CF|nr:hypothetical protein [Nocardia anaemiae]
MPHLFGEFCCDASLGVCEKALMFGSAAGSTLEKSHARTVLLACDRIHLTIDRVWSNACGTR